VCSIPSLGSGTSQSCAHLGTAAAGQYANQGKATGTPPGGLANISASDPSHYFGADPQIGLQKLTNDQDADVAPGPYILVGDLVSWTYEVSNPGNVALSDVSISDDNGTPSDPNDDLNVCTIPSLAVDETQTCTIESSAASGQYGNLGSASGTPPIGPDTSASDPSHYFGSQPGISLQKRTNDQDADSAPGPYILSGDTVTWEYQVSNTGNVALSDVTITDDNGTPTNPADDITVCTIASLGAGSDQTCTRSGTAAVGQYANLGSVAGTPPVGPDVSASDPSHYFGASPGISLQKRTNDQDADSAPGPYILIGEPVSWEYQVSNTGNVELSAVTVTDDNGTPTNPADDITVCTIASLGAGSDQTCSRSGTAAAGQYANLGSISGTPPVGPDVSDSDPSHYYGATAGLDLVKKTNGQDADSAPGPYILVGNSVNWAYDVTNTGEVALSDVTITDDNGTPGDPADDITVCTITTLSVGATRSCTRSGTSTAGQYTNLGSASGFYGTTEISNSDPSHYFGADPQIGLQKLTNDQDADSAPGPYILVGDPLSWEYQVSNQGNVDLADVTVTDDNGTPSDPNDDITVCTIPSLPAGEIHTCSLDSTAAAGQYANQGKVKGTPPGGLADISASDPSHYFGADPQIGLQKLTNGEDADSAPGPYILVGDPLSWSYEISNQGNVALSNVSVTDDNGTPSNSADDITVCTITSLAIGETQNCSLSGTAISGQYSNQGTASGTPPGGLSDINDTDPSHYFGSQPALSLVKETNGQDANEPPGPGILEGGAVEWTYEVSNTGNVSLSNLAVIDDNGTPLDLTDDRTICTVASLAAAGSEICTDSGLASAGQYENNATATGTPPGGLAQVSGSDNSHYFGEDQRSGCGQPAWTDHPRRKRRRLDLCGDERRKRHAQRYYRHR
jgi:plastocyanin